MSCEELREYYELYALGVLDGSERDEISEHLARQCPQCSAGLKRAVEWNGMLMAATPLVEPPARLRKRVIAAAGVQHGGWYSNMAWPAIAAALFAGVLWFSIQERRLNDQLAAARSDLLAAEAAARTSSADLARIREAMAFLSRPGTEVLVTGRSIAMPPQGRAFVHQTAGALLLASGLPPVGPGKIYEMWLIPRGGAPSPAGLFQPDATGQALHMHRGAVAAGSVVAVTVEPEAGSPAPTSTPIFVIGM